MFLARLFCGMRRDRRNEQEARGERRESGCAAKNTGPTHTWVWIALNGVTLLFAYQVLMQTAQATAQTDLGTAARSSADDNFQPSTCALFNLNEI